MIEDTEVGRYLKEISKYPLLTAAEEKQLARHLRSKKSNREQKRKAHEKLITSNLRLVVSVAKKFLKTNLPFSELIAEGNLGLIEAIKKFKPVKGYRLSTYATYWIRQRIQLWIRYAAKWIKVPGHLIRLVARLKEKRERFHQERHRQPTIGELLKTLNIRKDELRLLLYSTRTDNIQKIVSIDEILKFSDIESDDTYDKLLENADLEKIRGLLDSIDERQAKILKMRYGITKSTKPMSLKTIGQKLGITRERVRQLEVKAIKLLHHEMVR